MDVVSANGFGEGPSGRLPRDADALLHAATLRGLGRFGAFGKLGWRRTPQLSGHHDNLRGYLIEISDAPVHAVLGAMQHVNRAKQPGMSPESRCPAKSGLP